MKKLFNKLKQSIKGITHGLSVQELRANVEFSLATKCQDAVAVDFEAIPSTWEKFGNSQDEWVKIELPDSENTTACLYKAKAGSYFPPHFHKVHEDLIVLTPTGQLKSYTPKGNQIISYLQGVTYKPGEVHSIKFLTDCKCLVLWHPKFEKGWQGHFIEQPFKTNL